MPETLNTFLMTGKNKRIGVMQNACKELGLETKGIAEVVRRRLVKYAEGDEDKEKRIRELVRRQLEPPADDAESQRLLFGETQDEYRENDAGNSSSTEESVDGEEEDVEDADEENALPTRTMSSTSTPDPIWLTTSPGGQIDASVMGQYMTTVYFSFFLVFFGGFAYM